MTVIYLHGNKSKWGSIVYENGTTLTLMGQADDYWQSQVGVPEENSNSERAILIAVIETLEWVNGENILIFSDNIYCVNLLNDWLPKWRRDSYITNVGSLRPNYELLLTLDQKLLDVEYNFEAKWITASTPEIREITESLRQ